MGESLNFDLAYPHETGTLLPQSAHSLTTATPTYIAIRKKCSALNSHFILPASLPRGISPLKIPFSFLNTKKIHVKKESLFFLKNKNSVPNRTATAKIAKLLAA
jgi:hypothetical protein